MGLFPSKEQEHYQQMLNELDSYGPFQPDTVLADYELGLRNAIQEVWPSATVRGCYFHFKQSLWRNFQRLLLNIKSSDQTSESPSSGLEPYPLFRKKTLLTPGTP